MNRRQFLIASGVTGGAALAAGACSVSFEDVIDRARRDPLADGSGILVLVTLYGGNDGLNTVIPYGDDVYQSQRPDLAYAEDEVLALDDGLGLNPAMKGLKAFYDAGELAVVRGVGYPKPNRSHFASMDIWQTASPERPTGTGWLGRWLDATGDDPLRALNIGSVLPPLVVGEKATAAALDLRGRGTTPTAIANAFTGLARSDAADTAADALVARSCGAKLTVDRTVSDALAEGDDHDGDPEAKAGEAGGGLDLGRQLDLVARCIKAGVPTRAYTVSLGGFDTHADERATQESQLQTLDEAVTRFRTAIKDHERAGDVVVAVYSEFGRRVKANASEGTDHGTAGPMLVLGRGVAGGLHGEEPDLGDLDDGDLKMTTDFRRVLAELSTAVLGADQEQLFGQEWEPVGLFA